MTLVDGVAVLYAAVSAINGARNGVALEGYRLFRLLVSVLTGFGLFTLINQVISRLLGSLLEGAGGFVYIIGIGLAFYLLRKLKGAIIIYLQERFAARWNRTGGAIAAFIRATTAIIALVSFLHLTPWIPGGGKTTDHSVVGRIVKLIMPHTGDPQ